MSKFTSYDAPVQVGGPVNIPQASAADFGGQIGAAIQTSGALLSDAVAKHKVRQDKRDVVSAHAQLSDFKLERNRDAGEAMRNAGTGAPYVFDEQVVAFDEAFGTFTENMTDIQRQAIAATADTFRYSTLKTVSDFQAAEIVKADLGNMRAIALGIGSELHAGQRDMVSAEADFRRILDVSNLSDPGKEALMLEQLPIWRANLANGLLENPLEGSRALAAGELEGVLTDDEMTKFEDDLFKRLNGMETEALNKQLFEFAAYHPQALDAVVSGEITTLEGLEGLRSKISDELYKHLFQIVRDRVIPDRTEAEIADSESNILSDYNAMSMKRKKGKMTTSASLEEILRFQNNLGGLVAEGYISSTSAKYYMRRTEEAAQMLMDKAGATSDVKNKYGRMWNISVFDRGAQAINEKADDEGWDAGKRSRVFREYIELHEEFDKIPDADRSVKEAAGNKLVVAAIDNALRTQNPAFSHFDDMPDGIMTASGQILMATGSGAQRLKPTVKTLPFERVLHKKDATGKDVFWYNILDEFNRPIPGQHVEVFKAIGVNDEVDAFVDKDGYYLVQPTGKTPDESTQSTPESNASSLQSTEPEAGSATVSPLGDDPDPLSVSGGKGGNVIPEDALLPGMPSGTKMYQDSHGNYYYRTPAGGASGLPQEAAAAILQSMELDKPPTLSPHGRSLTPESNASSLQSTEPVAGSVTVTNLADNPEPIQGEYGINPKNVIPDDLLFPGSPPGTQLFQDATGSYYIREPGNPQRMGMHQDRAREVEKGMNLNGPLPLDPNVYGTDDAAKPSGAVTMVLSNLLADEGTGSTDGIPTLEGGLTKARKVEVAKQAGVDPNTMSDKKARELVVNNDHKKLSTHMTGYAGLPESVQASILQLTYNTGVAGVLAMDGIRTAVREGKLAEALKQTLDTAVVTVGKTRYASKGHAARRMRAYNRAAADAGVPKIAQVEQLPNGKIIYSRADGSVVLSFKLPKWQQSTAGVVKA